jgi:hypothetical protein
MELRLEQQAVECYIICATQQSVSYTKQIRIRVGCLMRSFRLSLCEHVKTRKPLNVISYNLKLEKFSKTVQPFKFLLTWDDYEKDVPHKKALHVLELRLFALLQCTIMGAYLLLSTHSIVVLLLEYKNKISWNIRFQRSKCTTFWGTFMRTSL